MGLQRPPRRCIGQQASNLGTLRFLLLAGIALPHFRAAPGVRSVISKKIELEDYPAEIQHPAEHHPALPLKPIGWNLRQEQPSHHALFSTASSPV
jgi:hypothetical protein